MQEILQLTKHNRTKQECKAHCQLIIEKQNLFISEVYN